MDMACLEHLHGMNTLNVFATNLILIIFSAEVVTQTLVAEHFGDEWCIPAWLPKHYLAQPAE